MARGRKRKLESQQQKHKITIWLTMEEKERLTARAGQIPISRFFRETLMRGRSPKQPPTIPEINLQAYRELSEYLKILKRLSEQFSAHTQSEQAQALAKGTGQIKEILERSRIALLALQNSTERHD